MRKLSYAIVRRFWDGSILHNYDHGRVRECDETSTTARV